MKRKALLIGNTNGLPGVKADIENIKTLLKSPKGGKWLNSEIIETYNPSATTLLQIIEKLKSEKPNFSLVLFSGHGAYSRQTDLVLNKNKEQIPESALSGISEKQLIIIDCCRAIEKYQITESQGVLAKAFETFDSAKNYRQIYDNYIIAALPQQMTLYSCAIGEYAMDTESGGLYSHNLMMVARNYKLGYAESIHSVAAVLTTENAKKNNHKQTPCITMLKIPQERQLILTIPGE